VGDGAAREVVRSIFASLGLRVFALTPLRPDLSAPQHRSFGTAGIGAPMMNVLLGTKSCAGRCWKRHGKERRAVQVLIAEDEPVSRHLLQSYLERWGYRVVSARDGAEAWGLFEQEEFPVVISDWMMPGMDGLELIRRIRLCRRPGYVYAILLTAKSQKEDLVQGMEAGADDFVSKPFDPDELRVRLREGERIIRLQQTLAEQNRALREAHAANANVEFEHSFSLLDRLALLITEHVGSVGFFLILLLWSIFWLGWNLVAPRPYRFDPAPAFVLWLFISNLIQITLMPLIMVGQNLQNRHSALLAESDFAVNVKAEKGIGAILLHLERQTAQIERQGDLLLELLNRLGRSDGAGQTLR
jgi:CheY-like chemotaxis protein